MSFGCRAVSERTAANKASIKERAAGSIVASRKSRHDVSAAAAAVAKAGAAEVAKAGAAAVAKAGAAAGVGGTHACP